MANIQTLPYFESNSISQRFGRNKKGGEFGFEIGTELRLGLNGLGRLRQKPYSESGREAGLGRV
jgi:hypothetical protein